MSSHTVRVIVFIFIFIACAEKENQDISRAERIIDQSIKASGVDELANSTIEFKFRDKKYEAERRNGKFRLQRSFKDSIGEIKDMVTNSGFGRYINDQEVEVIDSMATKYTESVNSVHYFSVLPYGLQDEAVNSEFLGAVKIKGDDYDKIKVTFDKVGGGSDHEDIYIYWFNQKTSMVDYLAYQFYVNGGGKRFREAYNERLINGIRIVDYKNYKPQSDTISLRNLDVEFENGNLELLSIIDLEEVRIR